MGRACRCWSEPERRGCLWVARSWWHPVGPQVTEDADGANEADATEGGGDAGGTEAIGTVGQSCTTANELACAGHAQKLVVYCDPGSMKWEVLTVCSGNQLCDTRVGANQGSCQDPIPDCIGKKPGDKLCQGRALVECGADLLTVTQSDCEFACTAGACSGACVPAEKKCVGTAPQTCDANGAWQDDAPCTFACALGKCTGECVPHALRCQGKVPEACDDTGTWVAATECPAACVAGACTGTCSTGDKKCEGMKPQTCDDTGQWQLGAPCAYVCSVGDCAGQCPPAAKQCLGKVPQQCDSAGQWQSGTVCANECSGGDCVAACTAGAKQCSGTVAQTCGAAGVWVNDATCQYVCAGGTCGGACMPDTKQCAGNVPQQCDAAGQWQTGADCPYVCASGACGGVCVPEAKRCEGTTPQLCGAAGTWQNGTSCPYVCAAAACVGECVPGATDCTVNTPRSCDPSGAWQNGTACQFVCNAGTCLGECNPGAAQCVGLVRETCDGYGNWKLTESCPYLCISGTCKGVCTPGAKKCDGQVPQTCSPDGQWQNGASCPYVCTAGTCAGACTPGAKQCNDVVPQTCSSGGVWESAPACPYVCAAGVCGGTCVPGAKQCTGELPQTCDANGAWRSGTICGGATTCSVAACVNCTAGLGDCDGSAANGCETPTNTSAGNCGACEKACSTVNGTASCTGGVCGITCTTGFMNCDGTAANGCEINTSTNVSNCGGCGKVCNATNGSASCAGGVCAITCSAGFANCDSNLTNGCETIGICSGPSCSGLEAKCGPTSNENCCASALVPAGAYPMGRSTAGTDAYASGDTNELPEHTATIAGFRLDLYEVTVGRFRKFVDAYPGSKPAVGAGANPSVAGTGWAAAWASSLAVDQAALKTAVKCDAAYQTWTDTDGTMETLPMNCVHWYDAFAFCAWDGGWLPTDAEWEKAAAGGDENRLYPWGAAAPTASLTVYGSLGDGNASVLSFADILTVGSKPSGKGRWGQYDLAGGMWEWGFDFHEAAWYTGAGATCTNCANVTTASNRVMRGGSWSFIGTPLRAAYRYSSTPAFRNSGYGIRCARSAQ